MDGFTIDTTAEQMVQEHHLPASRSRLDVKRFLHLLKRRTQQFRSHRYTLSSQAPAPQPSAAAATDRSGQGAGHGYSTRASCCLQSALAVYLFWWQKPLDIEHPTALVVDGGEKHGLWAWMFVHPGWFPLSCGKAPSSPSMGLISRRGMKVEGIFSEFLSTQESVYGGQPPS